MISDSEKLEYVKHHVAFFVRTTKPKDETLSFCISSLSDHPMYSPEVKIEIMKCIIIAYNHVQGIEYTDLDNRFRAFWDTHPAADRIGVHN